AGPLPRDHKIPHRGSVWIGSSLLYRRGTTLQITKTHIAAACGLVQVLSTGGAPSTRSQNPTSRQRVDWFKSSLPAGHPPLDHKIPHRGSVWIRSSLLYRRVTLQEITKSHIAAA